MSREKPRLPRIERSDDFHVDDDTSHLWAVSYADFLMVLLSFFILFFSVDSDEKNLLIRKIIEATETSTGEGQSRESASVGPGGVAGGSEAMNHLSDQEMANILKDFKVQIQKNEKMVEFQFPDDIFQVGQFELSEGIKHQLRLLISRLKPFRDVVDITIVGHTDAVPFQKPRARILNDNFDLSVIRAARAVQFAVSEGLSPATIAAKGSADSKRNSRTLSVVVKPLSP